MIIQEIYLPIQAKSLEQRIAALFAGGKLGAWYDYSLFAQQYQDSVGTTAVTAVEQPLGLVLDGKTGYARGPELAINGDFSNGLTGWNNLGGAVVFQVVGGVFSGTSSGVSNYIAQASGWPATVIGKTYELTWDVVSLSNDMALAYGGVTTPYSTAGGKRRAVVTATSVSTAGVGIFTGAGNQSVSVDNISVKEVAGNHLIQATSAARPVVSARVNLQLKSEFYGDVSGWASATGNTYTHAAISIGGVNLTLVTPTVTNNGKTPYSVQGVPIGASVLSFLCKANGYRYIQICDAGAATYGNLCFDSQTGVFTSNQLGFTTAVEDLGGGIYKASVFLSSANANTSWSIGPSNTAVPANPYGSTFAGDGVSGIYLGGIQMVRGSIAIPYQRVNTSTDYNTAGFPTYAKFDGVDDSMTSTTGGGATSGFFRCQAIKPLGGAGTVRTIWSDTGTNTGYKVQLDAANKLSFSAGNGAAYTTIASTGTVDVGVTNLITAWDDGTNLNVQINNATAQTVARPTVTAGTAGFTVAKDNGAATSFVNGNLYSEIYRTGTPLTATERASAQSWCKSKAGL